eukprot:TRINITY_DN1840_c0_g1_i1.p1 TRINITY_DN1840_c0_g1~~TRINITY_DN1840_c0_g1_i1.p1  ORF type:complete len:430 (-),score=57.26 TRINITY_DN1840_c0_g1_i1:159-1448(-)
MVSKDLKVGNTVEVFCRTTRRIHTGYVTSRSEGLVAVEFEHASNIFRKTFQVCYRDLDSASTRPGFEFQDDKAEHDPDTTLNGLQTRMWFPETAARLHYVANEITRDLVGSEVDWNREDQQLLRLDKAKIVWLRAGFLRACATEGRLLCRCQDLPQGAFKLMSLADVDVTAGHIVVSHPWLSACHPDPQGKQLQRIISELDRLGVGDDVLIFYDYCSLPQHDLTHPDMIRAAAKGEYIQPGTHPAVRTLAEQECCDIAVSGMGQLYAHKYYGVLIVPDVGTASSIPQEFRPNCVSYQDRGWCFFELTASHSHGIIINTEAPDVRRILPSVQLSVTQFEEEFRDKIFTSSGDRERVVRLYHELHQPSQDTEFNFQSVYRGMVHNLKNLQASWSGEGLQEASLRLRREEEEQAIQAWRHDVARRSSRQGVS